MLESKKKDDYLKVNNAEELFSALKKRETYIIIQDNFKREFVKNTQLPLTETELMGFELGFRGWSEIFFQIINAYSKGTKQQKKIDSMIRNYSLKNLNENEILLYLRQLDY